MNDLKPCPFCGGSAAVDNGPTYLWYVQCQECRIDGEIRPTKSEAIEAWNRRAQPAQAGAEPVAHFGSAYVNKNGVHVTTVLGPVAIPQDAQLYTHPPVRVPLTDYEIDAVIEAAHHSLRQYKYSIRGQQITQFDSIEAHVIRETERAHDIKE